jgi:hypothetical protein
MKPWPYPHDTELGRARRIAIAYRTHLHTANPAACAQLDAAMRDWGQVWLFPSTVMYDETDAVTADVAGGLVSRPETTIRDWARTPHPDDPSRMLLPRFGWDGRRRTYLVGDVLAAAAIVASRTRRRGAA